MHEPCDVNTLKHLKQIISRLSVLCDTGTFEGIFKMYIDYLLTFMAMQ